MKKTSFETLSQRLGVLDRERKAVILDLKKTPEYASKHLSQVLNSFKADNASKWFVRTNAKGESSYFKLVEFELMGKATETKHHSTLTKVRTVWDVYTYGSLTKGKSIEEFNVSIFNDLEAQILNGRKLATDFNEKKLVKESLTEKKKQLEEELKKLKAEIACL